MVVFKLFILVFIIIFINSCGVDTASSSTDTSSSGIVVDDGNNNDDDGDLDLIDPNPINNDTTDDNSTGSDDDDDVTNGGDAINSIFDHIGAIEDKFACMIGDSNDGYTNNTIADTSFDNQGEEDVEDGIGINSRFPYDNDILKTEVRVYYYDLKPARTMDIVSVYEADYRLDVDTGWANNDETVLYVRTPKDENDLYGCYRYELSSIDTDNTSLVGTKVYRNEI